MGAESISIGDGAREQTGSPREPTRAKRETCDPSPEPSLDVTLSGLNSGLVDPGIQPAPSMFQASNSPLFPIAEDTGLLWYYVPNCAAKIVNEDGDDGRREYKSITGQRWVASREAGAWDCDLGGNISFPTDTVIVSATEMSYSCPLQISDVSEKTHNFYRYDIHQKVWNEFVYAFRPFLPPSPPSPHRPHPLPPPPPPAAPVPQAITSLFDMATKCR